MKKNNMKLGLQKFEKIFIVLFFITLCVGIWQALPETSVIGDESLYVGGALRALQSHTIVPQIDNAYTLSFYASFILMIPVVALAFALAHFHLSAMISLLYAHYELLYLVPRAVSVLAGVGIAYVFLKMAQLEGHMQKRSILAATLILSTIVVTFIIHTGKMWTLSSLLILLADYFCAQALAHRGELSLYKWYRSPVFWCVGSAFLAFSNFPIAVIAFIAPAVLVWYFWKEKSFQKLFLLATIFWGIVFTVLTLLNLHGWLTQNAATPPGASHLVAAVWYQISLLPFLLPFLLLALIAHVDQVRNRALAVVALVQAGAFILLVAYRAPWVLDSTLYLRYFFLIVLLLGVVLIATSLKRERVLLVLTLLSMIFFAKSLYLMVVPTTYNQAYDWVAANIAHEPVLAQSDVAELDLPRTAASYALLKTNLCASRCEQEIAHPTSPYAYTLITGETDPAKISATSTITYEISSSMQGTPIKTFGENPTPTDYYEMNYNLGIYSWSYLMLPRLGPNIYVYRN